MSRSLIRKNQLHPDINDLVGQYGSGFFIPSLGVSPVYVTGNQTISGVKNFVSRPTVNGTGVILNGELSAYPTITQLESLGPDEGGVLPLQAKTLWDSALTVPGLDVADGDLRILRGGSPIAGITPQNLTSYRTYFLPNSNGTIALTNSTVLLTGNQTISGVKTFTNTGVFTSGIDLRNSRLINHVPEIITVNSNFILSGNLNSDVILASSPTPITGTLISGNPLGFHVSIIQVIGGYVRITGSGSDVTINSKSNQFRTSAPFAQINIIHTGNNGYIMYGDTQV